MPKVDELINPSDYSQFVSLLGVWVVVVGGSFGKKHDDSGNVFCQCLVLLLGFEHLRIRLCCLLFRGWASWSLMNSTESLILAQDERWRRA